MSVRVNTGKRRKRNSAKFCNNSLVFHLTWKALLESSSKTVPTNKKMEQSDNDVHVPDCCGSGLMLNTHISFIPKL